MADRQSHQPHTGRKLLLDSGETDFLLPGLMPIEWCRSYASDLTLTVNSVLGQGWVFVGTEPASQ